MEINLYNRIRQRREELGMSQDELAVKMGYKDRSTIAKIEAGVNDITQSKIKAFAVALNTTTAWLMGLDGCQKIIANFDGPDGWDRLDGEDRRRVNDFITALLAAEKYNNGGKEGAAESRE